MIFREYDKLARHGNHKDLKNIYFDSLYFILTPAIFLTYAKISTHANFMEPSHPRHQRHFFDPRQNFMDSHHPHQNFDPRHPRQNFTDPRPPRYPRQNLTRAIHEPTHPRYLADSVEEYLLETTQKIEGGNIENFCFQDKELTKIRVFKFFYIMFL